MAINKASATNTDAETKYLLLDSRVVEKTENTRLVLGTAKKDAGNPLFVEDKPWEPRFDNLYPNVLYDEQEKLYKCWYSPFIIDEAVTRTPPEKRKTLPYLNALSGNDRYAGVCYAFSKDGLKWNKPDLGLVDLDGSKANNIVLRGVHGAGIFKDLRDPDPARRYKLFAKTGEDHEPVGVAFSPDGLHWSKASPCADIGAAGDTHNNSFWDDRIERYVAITRLFDGKQRTVGRSESRDYLHWSKAEQIFCGNPQHQTYAMPVFRHANVYLGLVMILDTKTDLVDCELAWSPDGLKWERVCEGTPLIPRGPRGSFDYGCVYAAAYPVFRDGEIRLYYGGSDDTHGSWRKGGFGLARLRPDGFAGYEPGDTGKPAIVITRPIKCASDQLGLTADANGGAASVEVLDENGISLGVSKPITVDATDAILEWNKPGLLSGLQGRTVRLKFELRSARLYAFRF
ncbi:MAG TPA: hypothetical protein VLM89_06000 [Phycisphaerae bacterium]|nr:hypothetical protein [Phycisphaerae bacterium]